MAWMIVIIPTGMPTVKEAVDRAIEQVPGAVALVDGVIYQKMYMFILVDYFGMVVEGTPLIDPALQKQAGLKSNFIVAYQDPGTRDARTAYLTQDDMRQFRQALLDSNSQRMDEIIRLRAL